MPAFYPFPAMIAITQQPLLPFVRLPVIIQPSIIQEGQGMAAEEDAGKPETRHGIREELRALQRTVEDRTGLLSHWNGEVLFRRPDEIQMMRGRHLLAEKRWNCDVLVSAILEENPLLWRTLLHEMLHSVSVGLNEEDYRRFPGWEEGVVEWLQRRWRPEILHELGVATPSEIFAQAERDWPLNDYLEALQTLQEACGLTSEIFYFDLLRTPLAQRLATVRAWGQGPGFLSLFARTIGKLR